jgi:molecular chaperone HscB
MKKAGVGVEKVLPFNFKLNYFELFDLPESFAIDLKLLRERMRELQKQCHPDRFINSTPQEKRISMQYTVFVNEAFTALKSPVTRAAYLLKLHDVDVEFEKNTAFSAAFLMQQMDWRERIENDCSDEVTQEIESAENETMDTLERLFNKPDNESLLEAKELTRQLKFYEKLRNDL